MTGIRSNARAIHHCFSTQEANTTEGPASLTNSWIAPTRVVACYRPPTAAFDQDDQDDLTGSRERNIELSSWVATNLLRVLDDDVGTHSRGDSNIGRSNWLFAGSLRAGQRAAAIMSLIQSAKLNGHEPHAYLRDIFERLPTQPAKRVAELLPHRGLPAWFATVRLRQSIFTML
ncbi:hypothetical protein J2W28_005624 [Variovorax boronicumulans]|nr:hypothetical protein [Variovorax boronicumulans]MDQ0006453.1 hypothetical protein [Variovorax boronicumulans]